MMHISSGTGIHSVCHSLVLC